ncbi:Hypothetical predicted protein [Mytilus galloprovincialis]|uniref:Uncharacterized protein n=2 Tax=Mytilus galloprovincialis TaxID=29158 RepID=A0A8B6FEH7_MYTGA|nr:Hypothetical predicted protein [Mytilus galloprovincialis]
MQVTEVRQREVEASKSSQQKQHPYRYKKKKPGVKVSYIDKSDERKHKRTALAAAKSRAGSKLKQIALKLEKEQIFDPVDTLFIISRRGSDHIQKCFGYGSLYNKFIKGDKLTAYPPFENRIKPTMPVIKKDKVASFLTPGKGAYSFAQGSGQSISEAQRKQLENIHIAVNEDDISIEQPNQVTKRRGELKRLFSERSKTRGSRGRGCGRGRGGRRGGKSDNVKRKSSKVLLENNKPKRKTAKVLVYEDDNDMEVPDSREMSPVIVLEDVVLNSSLLREASVLMENMDFSVDPTAKEPTETPEQPEETQEQPKETQEQPEETQEQSEETQEQPEETQEQETQEQSEETQEQPEETQEQPEETQEQPKETQEQPEETQEQPKETQEQPEETQEQQHKKQGNTRTTKENTRTTKGNTRTTRGNTEQQRNNKNTKTQEQPEDILSKDDFVLVELPIEKTSRTKQFIGKIISVSEHDIDVSFMKKNKTGKFIWPEVMDQSMVERRSVKRKLKPPAQIAKRRSIEMFFSDMS